MPSIEFKAIFNRFLALTFALFVPVYSQARVCEPQVRPQGVAIQFKNGQQILIIGHNHGITENVMKLGRLATDTTSANDVLLAESKKRIKDLDLTLKFYREEVDFLTKQISAGRIQFIALEYGPEIMQMMTREAGAFLPMTKANLANRKMAETKLVDDSYLVFAGPTLYLVNTRPALMKNIRLAPIEDDFLMQRSLDYLSHTASSITAFTNKYPHLENVILDLFTVIQSNYDLHQYQQDEWLDRLIQKAIPQPFANEAKVALEPALEAAELFRQRDQQSSFKLLAQPGSGVLLIGSSHVRSLANLFSADCHRR